MADLTPLQDSNVSANVQPCLRRCRCIEQVWIDAVTASRDAAIRERDIALRELERMHEEKI